MIRAFSTFILIALIFVSGCATVTTSQIASTSYQPDAMDIVGKTTGESTAYWVLGIPISSGADHSSGAAIDQALLKVAGGANALINASVDVQRDSFFMYLVNRETIRVYGTAVKFKQASQKAIALSGSLNYGRELLDQMERCDSTMTKEKAYVS
jgi:hypothetical protein